LQSGGTTVIILVASWLDLINNKGQNSTKPTVKYGLKAMQLYELSLVFQGKRKEKTLQN